jgi:transcriptional regulator with XRE-family HTH domain
VVPHEILLGLAISKLRLEKGLSQEKFAELAGIHRTYVSQLERGLKSPTFSILRKLAAALGVSTSELIRFAEASNEISYK